MERDHPVLKISPRFSRGKPPNILPSYKALAPVTFLTDKYLDIDMHYRSCTFEVQFADQALPLTFDRRSDWSGTNGAWEKKAHFLTYNTPVADLLPTDKYLSMSKHYRSFTVSPELNYSPFLLADYHRRTECEASNGVNNTSCNTSGRTTPKQLQHTLNDEAAQPLQSSRLITEVPSLFIPYLAASVCLVTIRHTVCNILLVYHISYQLRAYLCMKVCMQSYHYNAKLLVARAFKYEPQLESNLQHCVLGTLCYYVITLTNCVQFAYASSYLCLPCSKTRKTVGGRKKPAPKPSAFAVSAPISDEDATPPGYRVYAKKSFGIYTRRLLVPTSGSCKNEQSSSTLSPSNTRLQYTSDVSTGPPTASYTGSGHPCHGNGKYVALSTALRRYDNKTSRVNIDIYAINSPPSSRLILTLSPIFVFDRETGLTITIDSAFLLIDNTPRIVFFDHCSIKTSHFITLCVHVGVIIPFITFVALPALGCKLIPAGSTPRSATDSNKTSSNDGNKNGSLNKANHSSRNSSISGRRPLRDRPGNQSRDDDEDDEDRKRNREFDKIKSQCERSVVPDTDVTNSTFLGTRSLSSAALEMSLFQGAISRVWDVTKNLTLFGAQQPKNRTAPNTTIDLNLSICSASANSSNISEVSINISHSKGLVHEPTVPSTSSSVTELQHDNQDLCTSTADEEIFTGVGNPEISPINNTRAIITPLAIKSSDRRALSNYISKSGPYEVPPASLLKRRIRSKINLERAKEQEKTSPARKRWSSESDATDRLSPAESIGCNRIRQSGRYDCSLGLKHYIYLEHNFLDMSDTKHINKSMLYEALKTALDSYTPDFIPNANEINTVTLAWDPREVVDLSKNNHLDACSQNITPRNCLLYLLSRLNHHTAKVIQGFAGFNGLRVSHIPSGCTEKTLIQIDGDDLSDDGAKQPLVVLHVGPGSGVNIIPRKFNRRIVDVYDVQVENFSCLIESREAYSTMETSIAKESSQRNNAVIIVPCNISFNARTDKGPEDDAEPVPSRSESMSTLSLTPSIQISSPPGDNRYFTPLSPTSVEKSVIIHDPKDGKDPETTPVSSNDDGKKVRNLQHLLNVPPRMPVKGHQNDAIRRKSFSYGDESALNTENTEKSVTNSDDKPQPVQKRRHASEGETSKLHTSNAGTLNYKKYQPCDDGLHHCDGWPFHFNKNFLKGDSPNQMKLLIQQEIKQNLQEVSPEITPGQSTLSQTDLAWDDKKGKVQKSPTLRALLHMINEHVLKITKQVANYNGIRIIYAYDRSVAMSLIPVNDERVPLVALHIGKTRDFCLTPTRFNPTTAVTDLRDVVASNFSLITIPYESSQQLRTYFAPEPALCNGKDQQILLIPYLNLEKTPKLDLASEGTNNNNPIDGPVTNSSSDDATIAAKKANSASTASNQESCHCQPNLTPGTEMDTSNGAESSKPKGNRRPKVDAVPIKLYCTTQESMKIVINDLKKPALKSWASTCGILHSNNPVTNKKKLCELLETCSAAGSTQAFSLLKLLTSKLND